MSASITQDRDGWSRVPHWLLAAAKPQAIVVYAALAVYADLPDGARPPIKRVAGDLGVSEATVRRAIRELEEVGAVRVEHRYYEGQQVASRYHLRLSSDDRGGSTSDRAGVAGVQGVPPAQMTYQEEDSVSHTHQSPSAAAASDDDDVTTTKRATRIEAHLDEDGTFPITPAMKKWGAAEVPHVSDPQRETRQFVDYWTAKGGKDARKTSWVATWRSWMRNADDRAVRYAPKSTRPEPGRVQR